MTTSQPGRAYYERLDATRFEPTEHVQGAWNSHEQHVAPVMGLLSHVVHEHEPRPDLVVARASFEILGLIPLATTSVSVRTVRPGRTIELIEATATIAGRDVVRASVWRLQRSDTAVIAEGLPSAMPAPHDCEEWSPSSIWPGGFIRTIRCRLAPDNAPGHGQAWVRTDTDLVAGESVSPIVAFLGLIDTANGMNTRVSPQEWAYPNIDLTTHLYREPSGGPGRWVGFDTLVTMGAQGVGLTSTTLHDEDGPVGQCEQILTLRRLTGD